MSNQSQTERVKGDAQDDKQGIFAPLIGHSGAKAILRAAARRGDVHILLSGPPGSGKSVALLAIESAVEDAEYVDARGFSERKLRDTLSENPSVLLLDEFDNMATDAYKALNTSLEQGRVTKNVHGDEYDVEIDTQVFGACNHIDEMPGDIEDRFTHVPFDPYTRDEYIDVCEILLPRQVDWVGETPDPETVAHEIATAVWDRTDTRSPRTARDAARLANAVERVTPIVKAMEDPQADVESEPVYPEDIPHNQGERREETDDGTEIPENPREELPHSARVKLERMADEKGIELTEKDYEDAYRRWDSQ